MIQIRRATTARRSAVTTPLEEGRPLFDTDQNALYIGDGKTATNKLSPVGNKISTGTSQGITVSKDSSNASVLKLSLKLDKLSTTTDSSNNYSGLSVSNSGLKLNVNVDATTSARTIKADSTSAAYSAQSYPVQIANSLSSNPGKLFVYVPWTNTVTTVSSGTGISVLGSDHSYTLSLKSANSTELGGIKLTVNGKAYDSSKVINFITT